MIVFLYSAFYILPTVTFYHFIEGFRWVWKGELRKVDFRHWSITQWNGTGGVEVLSTQDVQEEVI